ncbi:MAG: LytR C-terminal domain-containing protein [Ignavibacteriales bacterium]|nr:LytR C-terminal domain-containing protein [Ignavibacteriales bacterium]
MTEHKQEAPKTAAVKPLQFRTILISALVVFALFDSALAGVLIYRLVAKPAETKVKYVNKTFLTQVEVLNACGKTGATDAVVNFLRKKEVDVVLARNYISFDLDETLVVCRNENREKAVAIAAMLGLSEERVVQLTNKDYFLDATILLGKDYSRLGSTGKGKH